jgi:predicted GNAT family N-acyltransferase
MSFGNCKKEVILSEMKIPNLKVEIVKSKDLNKKDKHTLEELRVKEFGEENRKDFKKDYEPDTLWVMIKKKDKIVSFGGIRPIKLKYQGKFYHIGGMCSTISVIKKKGYGKIMVNVMKDYSEETGKTILGFTNQTKFFEKAGLGTKKKFIKRFIWIKSNGEKIYDNDGDGIYYEGKDKLISKMLKNKFPAYIFVEFW